MKTYNHQPSCSRFGCVWTLTLRSQDLPWVQDAHHKYCKTHNGFGIPPLKVRRSEDWLLCANDQHSSLIFHLQGVQCGCSYLLVDTEEAGITDSVWQRRGTKATQKVESTAESALHNFINLHILQRRTKRAQQLQQHSRFSRIKRTNHSSCSDAWR